MTTQRVAAIALMALLAGCSEAGQRGTPQTAVLHPASSAAAGTESPFAHLADDMSNDCISSATDPRVKPATVYLRCLGAHNALLNAGAPQPYADDNAVTASVLEIYAAYALRQASASSKHYSELLRDADSRLRALSANASTAQTRERAVAARSCLIQRDAACLEEWSRYQ